MITTAELHRAADREGLRFDQVEKDYIIVWLLRSLAEVFGDSTDWTFKGGTCLRHCYYAGYRFSEDIDFSCRLRDDTADVSLDILTKATHFAEQETGLEFTVGEARQSPGLGQMEIPVQYTRGGPRRRGLPTVKVHLTFDESILRPPESCEIRPLYSDLAPFRIDAYSKIEVVAEKMRALLQQQDKWPRPRDLYDLWFILCHKGEVFPWETLQRMFSRKCEARGITPDWHRLTDENLRAWNREAWETQIVPMMTSPPEYEQVWSDWVRICADLL